MKRKLIALLLTAVIVLIAAGCGGTQQGGGASAENGPAEEMPANWPNGETINIVVPWKAGGSADLMVRAFLPYWQETAGCTFVVDNREGATTMVGSVYFQSLVDDGSYIYSGTQPYISGNQILQGADYEIADFHLLNMQQIDPTTFTVRSDSPYQTVEELIAAITENPGTIKVGLTPGGGGEILLNILGEALDNFDVKIVTYDSGNDFRTALLGGHVDFITSSVNGDLALGDEGKVLAVCGDERSDLWPDAPAFAEIYPELGIPASLGSCRFFAVHSSFVEKHPDKYQRLLETYEDAFNNPDYQAMLEASGEASVSAWRGPEASNEINLQLHALIEQYKDVLNSGL